MIKSKTTQAFEHYFTAAKLFPLSQTPYSREVLRPTAVTDQLEAQALFLVFHLAFGPAKISLKQTVALFSPGAYCATKASKC